MSWFSKKESVSEGKSLLPDLPSTPINPNAGLTPEELSRMDLPDVEVNELSPFGSEQNKNLNGMIDLKKDSSEMQKSEFKPITPPKDYTPDFQPIKKFVNIQEKPIIAPRNIPLRNIPPKNIESRNRSIKKVSKDESINRFELEDEEEYQRPSSKEPVYVRLDKFETTLDAFEEIKDKVNEIERLLSRSKQIKDEEEKELEEWEKEIHAIKSRLDSIDKNMFSKFS